MRIRCTQTRAAARLAGWGGAAWALALGCSLGLAGSAGAIIVAGNPGQNATPNTTAPTGFEDAWARVGFLGGGSGVYLGNGYVLSATHVSGGAVFSFDGQAHTRIAGSSVTLDNPEGFGLSATSDLWINRYIIPDDSPLHGLGVIDLLDTPLANEASATLIGMGRGQTTTMDVAVGGGWRGYAWSNDEVRRWGETGLSSETDIVFESGIGVRGVQSSLFLEIDGRTLAASGDSGGGVFVMGDNGPVLGGIIHAVTGPGDNGQLANTSAFGNNNRSYFSDLSLYLDQIHVVEGDLTGDGYVGADDLDLVLARWGTAVTAGNWTLGDANGDGLVGDADLDVVLAHFGEGTLPAATVPEPGTGALVAMCVLVGVAGRSRRLGRNRDYYENSA